MTFFSNTQLPPHPTISITLEIPISTVELTRARQNCKANEGYCNVFMFIENCNKCLFITVRDDGRSFSKRCFTFLKSSTHHVMAPPTGENVVKPSRSQAILNDYVNMYGTRTGTILVWNAKGDNMYSA